jgi:hypothetical protein
LHPSGDEFLGLVIEHFRAGASGLKIIQIFLHPLTPDGTDRLGDQGVQAMVYILNVGIFRDGVLLFGHRITFLKLDRFPGKVIIEVFGSC